MKQPKFSVFSFQFSVLILAAILFFSPTFHTFGEDAPAKDAASGERISTDGAVDMDADALNGVLERLSLPGSDVPAKKADPATKTATVVKKKEEGDEGEEILPGGEGDDGKGKDEGKGGEIDLAPLKLSAEQITAVEQAIADGTDLTGMTLAQLEEFGFTGQQALDFEALVKGASAETNETILPELAALDLSSEQLAKVTELLKAKETAGSAKDVEKLKTDLATANAEAGRLQAELTKKPAAAVAIGNLHPVLLIDDLAKLNAREREIMEFEQWAAVNMDGTEDSEVDGKTVKGVSKEEVRAANARMQQERQVWIPKARAILQSRQQADQAAAQVYPALKDAKSPESVLVANIISQAPGLAAIFPNIKMIIADAIVGERVRQKAAQSAKKPGLKLTVGKGGVGTVAKVAPKLPMGASPSRAGGSGARKGKDSDISERSFVDMKAAGASDRDALVALLGRTNLAGKS